MAKWVQLTTEDLNLLLESTIPEKLKKKFQKALKPITSRSAKSKGAALQNDVGQDLADYLGVEFSNSDDNACVAARPMGQHGTDIILRGEAFTRLPFSFECKNVENLSLVPTVQQALANTKDGRDYVIVHRKKALPSDLAIISWEAFLSLMKKAKL